MNDSAIGSLRIQPRRPGHVHGDGDDGTTTRWHKAHEMAGGINLRDPVRSIRRHDRSRRLIGGALIWAFIAATALMAWRAFFN